jgi:hypothetical protein
MTTVAHAYGIDQRFFDELWPIAYPEQPVDHQLKQLMMDGVISVEILLEVAISRMGNLPRLSTQHQDFIDHSDAKKTSVRMHGGVHSGVNVHYGAPIGRVHTKRGYLRVMCYERQQDRFYYFLIPPSAYCHINDTTNIEIQFELDGTPSRKPKRRRKVNFWNYEVPSFVDICAKV